MDGACSHSKIHTHTNRHPHTHTQRWALASMSLARLCASWSRAEWRGSPRGPHSERPHQPMLPRTDAGRADWGWPEFMRDNTKVKKTKSLGFSKGGQGLGRNQCAKRDAVRRQCTSTAPGCYWLHNACKNEPRVPHQASTTSFELCVRRGENTLLFFKKTFL